MLNDLQVILNKVLKDFFSLTLRLSKIAPKCFPKSWTQMEDVKAKLV